MSWRLKMLTSAFALLVAMAARLLAFSEKPMEVSWATTRGSGFTPPAGVGAGPSAAIEAGAPLAGSSGCSSSLGAGPRPRRPSRLRWSGT